MWLKYRNSCKTLGVLSKNLQPHTINLLNCSAQAWLDTPRVWAGSSESARVSWIITEVWIFSRLEDCTRSDAETPPLTDGLHSAVWWCSRVRQGMSKMLQLQTRSHRFEEKKCRVEKVKVGANANTHPSWVSAPKYISNAQTNITLMPFYMILEQLKSWCCCPVRPQHKPEGC